MLTVLRRRPPLPDMWSLPGGHVELGETLLEAAARELMEETGITADLGPLVGVYDVIRRSEAGTVEVHYAIACFAGLWRSGEMAANDDAADAKWLNPEALRALPLTPNIAEAVEIARKLLNI